MYPPDLVNAAQCQLVQAVIDYKRCKCFYADCPFPNQELKNYLGLDCEDNYALSCPSKPLKRCDEVVDADGFLTLSASAQFCPYNVRLGNYVDGTPRAHIALIPESFNHSALLGVYAQSFGCGDIDGAIQSNTISVYTNAIYPSLRSFPNGYITKMKFYTSATNSVLVDISPINLSFWTSCSNCSPVNPSHLVFSSSSFPTALKTLLENVAATLFNAPASNNIKVQVSSLGPPFYTQHTVQIRTAIKHQGTTFLTINPQDNALYFSPGTIGGPPELLFMGQTAFVGTDDLPVFSNTYTMSLGACTQNFNVAGTSPYTLSYVNTSATSVNNIVLNNGGLAPVATTITPTSVQCNEYILSASHNLPGNIVSKGWYFPVNTLISNNDTIVVSTPGTYHFKIQTDVLPLITKSITVP